MELRDWIVLAGGGGIIGILSLVSRWLHVHAVSVAANAVDNHVKLGTEAHPGRWVDWTACRQQETAVGEKLDRLSEQIQRVDRKLEHISGQLERSKS